MPYSPTYKRRAPRRRNKKPFIIAGAAALAVVLLLLYLFFFTSVFGARSAVEASPIPAGAQAASGGGGLYYLKGTTLYHTDASGKELWSSKFSTGALELRTSDSLICVFDETSASVIDPSQNPLFTVPPSEFTIVDAACGNSTVAFLSKISGNDAVQYLRVFDKEGTELYRAEVANDDVLKFGLSGSGDTLWTLTLDTTGVSPISRVTTMNPSQKKLTGNIDVSDQLISNVFFTDTEMFLFGTSNLSRYNSFSEKQSDILVYGLSCVDSAQGSDGKAYFAYLPSSATGKAYNVRIICASPGTATADETLIQLPKGIFDYSLTSSRLYCFSKNSVYVYKTTGEFVEQHDLEFGIDSVKKLSDNLCLLSSGNSTYLFSTK